MSRELDDRQEAMRSIAAHAVRECYALRPEPRRPDSFCRRLVRALREFLSLNPWIPPK